MNYCALNDVNNGHELIVTPAQRLLWIRGQRSTQVKNVITHWEDKNQSPPSKSYKRCSYLSEGSRQWNVSSAHLEGENVAGWKAERLTAAQRIPVSGRIVGGLDDVTRLNEGCWTEGITRLYRWRMVLGVRCAKEGWKKRRGSRSDGRLSPNSFGKILSRWRYPQRGFERLNIFSLSGRPLQ